MYEVALVQVACDGHHHGHTQEKQSKYPARGRIHSKFRGRSSGARVTHTHTLCNLLPHTLNAASTGGAGAQLGMEVSTGLEGAEEPGVHHPGKGEPQDGPLRAERQAALADNAREPAKVPCGQARLTASPKAVPARWKLFSSCMDLG